MFNRSSWSASPLGLLPGWGSAALYAWWLETAEAWGYLMAGLVMLIQFVSLYAGASHWSQGHPGEFFRGFMVGLSAGVNAFFWGYLCGWWLAGLLLLLLSGSTFLVLSRDPRYQAALGWVNWWLPLSWPVNLPGALMLLTNLAFLPVSYCHPLFRPIRVKVLVDPQSGSLTCYGGLLRPFKGFSGLNMGNFIFINPGFEHLRRHEIGHLFSLAAMGAAFHYIGGVDEAMLQKNYWEAYAEHLADSYSTPTPSVRSIWG